MLFGISGLDMSADVLHFVAVSDLPNRIRELRLQISPKMSQEKLAALVGVSKVTISDLERGGMTLTVDYMQRIGRALGVPPADLLHRDDNPAALSIEERELIDRLRAASEDQRQQLRGVADVLLPFKPAEVASDRLHRRRA